MSNVILLGISILLATASNLLLRRFRNNGLRGTGDVLWFNALISVVWLAELAVMNGFKPISMGAILWGVLYGVGLTVFQLSKMQSISSGPVSLTTFIGCSALLIQTVFGVDFYIIIRPVIVSSHFGTFYSQCIYFYPLRSF